MKLEKGDLVCYEKTQVMPDGELKTFETTSRVVMKTDKQCLLEDGTSFWIFDIPK